MSSHRGAAAPVPKPAVSVIVACSRPQLIAGIAEALEARHGDTPFELLVAGDVDSLSDVRFPIPIELIRCASSHPNARRNAALDRAQAPVLAFLDDDAVPEAGWLAMAATMATDASEIWTGPERPTRSSRAARLAYATTCTVLAEGGRVHVDRRERTAHWAEAPFCNLVTTRRVIEEVGPPSSDVVWDLDDFEFCRRAHRHGVTFRNEPRLRIRHDRYPDRLKDWLADKAQDRRRTGQKIVSHPELYRELPGALIAALAPPLLAGALLLTRPRGTRHDRSRAWARRTLVGTYACAVAGSAVAGSAVTSAVDDTDTGVAGHPAEADAPGAAARALTLVALHVVSVAALQYGLLEGLGFRLAALRRRGG